MILSTRFNFLLILTLICTLTACKENNKKNVTPLQTVVVAPVTKQFVTESATVVGQIVAKENVFLTARVRGFLEKQNFKEGAFVKKGELLYVIEQARYIGSSGSSRSSG